MKRTFLTLAVAAHLAAGGAIAQTTSTTTGDTGMMSGSFGSDWSTSLGSALLGEDGTTVRSESEIASAWEDLSDEDKEMIRRDCAAYSAQSDDSDASDSTATTMDSSSDTSQSGDATSDASDADDAPMNVTMEQMEEICAATEDL
ncbi:hypothetical protein [Lacimonas salitolerans]|uniref:HdeA/HdeB family protein n=1 Tax=Lacimonas salitolerans TaxID=1323750 RepID=A0ABW4ELA0_9RHOB